ncbi:TetR family transcriptional regulator [Desulfitobacterium sp. LBE]|uniref:Regulatory protein TetR n=3 Tax=root TaxID=1 RepID=A0A098B2Y9_DESHA|nr:TetR/AcrR family transcriptional regulator [Desulfitobacterium hafniense]TWH55854.1 TetR family transcriptional regulator [Desulfitobacterium sp. LBE]CDX02241.1 Regulatory protein TetR [Desulfitobacterium hafniense]
MMPEVHIPEDKKQRIIRAALEHFAKNGYKKTTMDEIVAAADISKGLIFHYFGNKKKLYLYLYEFVYGLVYDRIVKSFEQKDLFERIRESERIKLAVVNEYPYVLDFLLSVRRETDESLREELSRIKVESFPPWQETFQPGLDTSKLREGIDLEKVTKIISWTTDGLLSEHKDDFVLEDIFAEMDEYLNLMRKAFYKEEYQ